MEHRAVWVTYRPEPPASHVESVRQSVPHTYRVLPPFEGLPAPVVASAWRKQLSLKGLDDTRLAEFIRKPRQSPQAPEPGAACPRDIDGGPNS